MNIHLPPISEMVSGVFLCELELHEKEIPKPSQKIPKKTGMRKLKKVEKIFNFVRDDKMIRTPIEHWRQYELAKRIRKIHG